MPKCLAHSVNGTRCENEALDECHYCSKHKEYEDNQSRKISDIIAHFDGNSIDSEIQKKDVWDKLSSAAALITGLFVGLVGITATAIYNNRELESQRVQQYQDSQIRRVEIIQKFFPYLVAEGEAEKDGAILAIAGLGDEELATRLAEHFGSREVLTQFASSSNRTVAEQAAEFLTRESTFQLAKASLVRVVVAHKNPSGGNSLSSGSGFVISKHGYIITAAHVLGDSIHDWTEVYIGDDSRSAYPATVVMVDVEKDISILKVEEIAADQLHPLKLNFGPPSDGEELLSVGYRGAIKGPLTLRGHLISRSGDDGVLIVDVPVGAGFSGAPVLNLGGDAIGYVVGAYKDGAGTLVMPLENVRSILETIGI